MTARPRRVALGLLLGLLASAARAEAPESPADGVRPPSARPAAPAPEPAADPPIIQRLRERGVTAESVGSIGRDDLRIWRLVAADGQPTMVLTTKEGFLLQGQVFAPNDGSLLVATQGNPPLLRDKKDRLKHGFPLLRDPSSARSEGAPPAATPPLAAVRAATPAPSAAAGPSAPPPASVTPAAGPSAATLWAQLGQATVIEEGAVGAPLVYIFIDPFCRYCHQQWTMLRAKVRQGQLRVRWAPVAVLEVSLRQRSVVMGLLDPPSAATLAGWMEYRRASPQQSEAAQRALARNLALFVALGVRSVPALVYKDQAGELVVKAGVTPL